ncbi:hypothetical protein MOUN0_M08042 [Monosporozyma unispora]
MNTTTVVVLTYTDPDFRFRLILPLPLLKNLFFNQKIYYMTIRESLIVRKRQLNTLMNCSFFFYLLGQSKHG